MLVSGNFSFSMSIILERAMDSVLMQGLFALKMIQFIIPFLAIRRLWRIIKLGEKVPASFNGFTQYLTYFSILSITFPIIALIPVIIAGTGSGVPAGMLLLVPTTLLPLSYLFVEIKSLRAPPAPERPANEDAISQE